MIAKHVPMKATRKSNFSSLLKYLIDSQGKSERVGHVMTTNCHQLDAEDASIEILATQALNTRAESDKTYHLIVSFRAGENPSLKTLNAIEARICFSLGYGDHQRISVVHHDTDNVHIHMAINKIHPTRYTIHEPYKDHKTLGQICEKLEREYGLETDNHKTQKCKAENQVANMERHSGIESLIGWIQRECLAELKGARSWDDMHRIMRQNGLEVTPRGNGLVIKSVDGAMVKASSVDRTFSKAKLEARLGLFVSSSETVFLEGEGALDALKISRKYEEKPLRLTVETVDLYAKYKAEQALVSASRTAEWALLGERKSRMIEAAKRAGCLKRAAIKLMGGDAFSKKILYALISKTLKSEIQQINKKYLKERQEKYQKYKRLAWADWLRNKATEGNQEALIVLRARDRGICLNGDTVSGCGEVNNVRVVMPQQDSITKKGTIIYRVGTSAIRDDGDRLNISKEVTKDSLEAALCMAMHRYGDCIVVNGSTNFKEQVVRTAAIAKLPISFADEALEHRRQYFLSNPSGVKGELNDERKDRGRIIGRDVDSIGSTSRRSTNVGNRHFPSSVRDKQRGNKRNVSRIGCNPPPESKNCLRGLSKLGVVCLASGSEVLLPRYVFNHMEQQGTAPNNGMRWNISGAGGVSTTATAVDKYISEREEKRLKLFDISKHRRYNSSDEGVAAYAGVRRIDGQFLALLERAKEIMVLDVDETTARRIKHMAIGDLVNVTGNGSITRKGRSR